MVPAEKSRLRVLLLNPPADEGRVWVREGRCQQYDIWGAPFPPISLAYMKAMLRGLAETMLLDPGPAGMDRPALMKRIAGFRPDLCILSTSTPTFLDDCRDFGAELKAAFPAMKLGATGIHVTALPKESLEAAPALDFVIRGEPEPVVRPLAEALISGRGFESVPGVSVRFGEDVRDNPLPHGAEDLDEYGMPDWSDTDFANYLLPIKRRPFTLVAFSRGCPHSCRFCAASSYYGKKSRRRSVPSLLKELDLLMERGVRDFLFWTEMMSGDGEFLESFLEALLAGGYGKRIRWVCNARADQLSLPMLEKMRLAGCWQIAIGLEFGTDRALGLARKGGGASVEGGRKAVEMAEAAGLVVDGHFILGFPGETVADVEETISFAASLPLTFAHFYTASPFPGSALYDENRTGLSLDGAWKSIRQDDYVFVSDGLDRESVLRLMAKAYRVFYASPGRIVRIFRVAEGPMEKLRVAVDGLKLAFRILFR